MKFFIKQETSKDINVISFKILENKETSIWRNWKSLAMSALGGGVIVAIGFFLFFQSDLNKFEVSVIRSTAVTFGSNDEQKRHSKSADGVATSSY